jgi:HSP20 family protein
MTILLKRLLITLGTLPLIASAVTPSQPLKTPCDRGCPLWGFEEMESFFNRPFFRGTNIYSSSSMSETPTQYLITFDLPGIDKKEIAIETSGDRLMIKGEHKEDNSTKDRTNRSFRSINQSIVLPDDADMSKIHASAKNGVLTLTIPKIAGKKVSRKIEIQ